MNLTTAQAAKRLGVSTHTVRVWGNQGKIVRTKVGGGKDKKHFTYDSKSVGALAAQKKREASEGKLPRTRRAPAPALGVMTRLDRMEQKLDQLLRMWS